MLIYILLASLLVSSISFIGGLLLLSTRIWNHRNETSLVSFAAGIMLSAAFLDLLPESIEAAGENPVMLPAFIGVVGFFLLERFVIWFHHHDDGHGEHPSTVLVLIGDAVHNVLDGIAIAAAFLVNPALGITTTLAIAAHEIPQEIADFSILVGGGMKKTKALFFNFLSGLTSVVGAIAGYYFLERLQNVEWIFLSFSAGMFIYISCSDLIPELHQEFKTRRTWLQAVPFFLGILLMYALIQFHSH